MTCPTLLPKSLFFSWAYWAQGPNHLLALWILLLQHHPQCQTWHFLILINATLHSHPWPSLAPHQLKLLLVCTLKKQRNTKHSCSLPDLCNCSSLINFNSTVTDQLWSPWINHINSNMGLFMINSQKNFSWNSSYPLYFPLLRLKMTFLKM